LEFRILVGLLGTFVGAFVGTFVGIFVGTLILFVGRRVLGTIDFADGLASITGTWMDI
jgi:ABC-type phosphate/phosphonate transport system permease subunit